MFFAVFIPVSFKLAPAVFFVLAQRIATFLIKMLLLLYKEKIPSGFYQTALLRIILNVVFIEYKKTAVFCTATHKK